MPVEAIALAAALVAALTLPTGWCCAQAPVARPVPSQVTQVRHQVPAAVRSLPLAQGAGVVRPGGPVEGEEDLDFAINTDLPGPDRLFRRESEKQVFERIRQDARRKAGNPRVVFPAEPVLSTATYAGRSFPRTMEWVEPGYVCHGRLMFEQPNLERQGWNLGVLTPVAAVTGFYYDLALFPYHYWTRPLQRWDCSAGKCLPGDPSPLLFYPEEYSLTGLLGQAAFIAGGIPIFP